MKSNQPNINLQHISWNKQAVTEVFDEHQRLTPLPDELN